MFVPVTDTVCRCAYITKKVRFNRTLEEITAVVLLNRFVAYYRHTIFYGEQKYKFFIMYNNTVGNSKLMCS